MLQALPLEISEIGYVADQVADIVGHLDLEDSPTTRALELGKAKLILRDPANDDLSF